MKKNTKIKFTTIGNLGQFDDELKLVQTLESVESDSEILTKEVTDLLYYYESRGFNAIEVTRDIEFISFAGNQNELRRFYDDLLVTVGMNWYFEITCSKQIQESLTQEQQESMYDAFSYSEDVFKFRCRK
jgi:hypothetical protein